jgi:flavin-dependent dehydrogenase
MESQYDVAIVGGGPAGSWLARELARHNRSVTVLERSSIPGEPNFSSAASPASTTNEFDLPRGTIAGECSRLRVTGPNTTMSWGFADTAYHVYDFRALKRTLLQQAEQVGTSVRYGTTVTGTCGTFSLKLKGGEIIKPRIIVDASGPSGVVADSIGLRKGLSRTPAVGMEMIAKVDFPEDASQTLVFYLGSSWAPNGYGWIFPMKPGVYKVGVCTYTSTAPLRNMFDQFIKRALKHQPHHVQEIHGGALFVTGGIHRHVYGNVIAIGDSAHQTNPLGGEGVRHVLHSARFAFKSISDALDSNNMQKLQLYDRLWKRYIGLRWNLTTRVARRAYLRFSDETWDRVIRLCSHLSEREIHDVLFEYRMAPVFRNIVKAKLLP